MMQPTNAPDPYPHLPALPMTPRTALSCAIYPALSLLPDRMESVSASRMLVVISLQESRLAARRQAGGPARGLWQFECGNPTSRGGVWGVLHHPATAVDARSLCKARGVESTAAAVYAQLAHDDVLAAGFARLLLWTDPRPLPGEADVDAAWAIYLNTWRPGRPHEQLWAGHWQTAVRACQ